MNKVKGLNKDYPGIYVPKGSTLTIQGNGTLNVSCGLDNSSYAAGIGAGTIVSEYFNYACGNIKILGGNIVATGGAHSAGIGGSTNSGTCGSITIYGGSITATGGEYGAGIGSGGDCSCGNITIYGGTITAKGGTDGAGIGSGEAGRCGNITISGGTIDATGGYVYKHIYEVTGGAGIGSGDHGSCGDITITTGVTRVKAQSSPVVNGIGPGIEGACGTVSIGGTVVGPINSPYTYEP